jgi:hypothetical protein
MRLIFSYKRHLQLKLFIGQIALTLVTNDNKFWMKEKINEIRLHPLISHTYCRLQLRCNFFGEQWEQVMCCHMFQLLIIKNILLLF